MRKENLEKKITELKGDFKDAHKRLKLKHLITRRIGSFHFLLFLVTVLLSVIIKYTSITLRFDIGILSYSLAVMFSVILIILIFIGRRVFFANSNGEKKNSNFKTSLALFNFTVLTLYIIALIVFTLDALIFISGFCLLIYLVSYLSNKQHGYTRGFARNETYYFLLESLEWEVQQLDGKNNFSSNLKLDELTLKFTRIIEAQLHERQRDIIGDYLSTNDASLSWIKSIKK